jgi:UDP-3-O-[3-hydroxymyristoyl] N-acetylglucosamine deacetylase
VRRKTIQSPISISGRGLHAGKVSTVRLRPKLQGPSGWLVNGIPLKDCELINARLATRINAAGYLIATTEHLFAALVGLGITDIHVETTDLEIPILDGSSKVWFDRLTPMFIDGSVEPLRISQEIKLKEGTAQLSIAPSDTYCAKITVKFDGYHPECFEGGMRLFAEAAHARTFGYIDELAALHAQDLALGAQADNVLALYRHNEPPIDQPPKQPHELAKHKWLDLIGDLALVGRPIIGKVESIEGGHGINHSLVHQLRELAW